MDDKIKPYTDATYPRGFPYHDKNKQPYDKNNIDYDKNL